MGREDDARLKTKLIAAFVVLLANAGSGIVPAGAQGTVPAFDHIFVIVEENHAFSDIIGSVQAPYINGLAGQNGLATQYLAITHPSLPNYLVLTGGDTFGSGRGPRHAGARDAKELINNDH